MDDTFILENHFYISTNKSFLNHRIIHDFLCERSYWAKGIPMEILIKSIENTSLCFGVYKGNPALEKQPEQVGFARVISDLSTFAYLADVFILEDYRGLGLGKQLIQAIIEHPELQELRRFMLATKDAHALYAQYGFKSVDHAEMLMQTDLKGYK